jgi:drug/metabolite transporter (DMT)-like permease
MDIASLFRLFLLAAIWGGSFLFLRIGAPVFGPAALIVFRVSIAAVFLWLASLWLKKSLEFRHHWKHFLIIGLLNSAFPFLLFAYAAQSLSASLLSILNATSALWGAIIAALWLRTPITRSIALGLLCGLAGVALLVGNGVSLTGSAGWPAIAAGLIAPISYSVASTYTKACPSSATPFANAHGSMWMASLIVLPVVFFVPLRHTPLAGDWVTVSALGILCTGAAYLLYFRLIQDVGPTRALSVTFLIPVFGVLWGKIFLNEAIGWDKMTGGLLVLAGIALTTGLAKLPGGVRT